MTTPKTRSRPKKQASANKVSRNTRSASIPAVAKALSVRSAGKIKLTHFIRPMLAGIADQPFNDPEWIFEIKWDGYRAIAETGNDVRLYSRNGLSFDGLYPKIVMALAKIRKPAILDGEIVVLNERNQPDFQKLQQYDMHRTLPLVYYVFDCLSYNGQSIAHLPLTERKKYIEKVIPAHSNVIRYSDHVAAEGVEFFKRVREMDVEGMIAKKADSIYQPGKRTRDWLKIKNHNTQEGIIAGYTDPKGSRTLIGALILAINDHGKLKYIGHTGTGFTNIVLKQLHEILKPLKRNHSPFAEKIPVNGQVTWVEPRLVCAVKFTEVTADGILRHPVYMGLRVDKSAKETNTLDKSIPMQTENTPKPEKKTSSSSQQSIQVGGRTLVITNVNKIYWPDEKITKGDVLQYYLQIHRYILPHLKGRPQSLRRNPNGIRDEGFFQKNASESTPGWVKTTRFRAESANRNIDYIVCNDLATLLYLNNLGCIELNPWNSRVTKPDHPDYMVIDIDPSEKNSFDEVIETAQVIHEVLERAGAPSYCKTSGATGLHIYVPLHAAYTYEQVREFAGIVVKKTEEILPNTITERALDKRKGRIYLDYLQNKKGQTLASVYSLRPKPGAPVSTPLTWQEVKTGLLPGDFTIRNILTRLEKTGDLFSPVLKEKINLKKCLKNLEK